MSAREQPESGRPEQPRVKRLPPGTPWAPVAFEPADASAVQALYAGTADPQQQRRALLWVIEQAAGREDFHYHTSDRDTAVALGRAFVGQQVRKLLLVNVSRITSTRSSNENG